MKPAKWPFIPDHITNDSEEWAKRNLGQTTGSAEEWGQRDVDKLTGVGIISNEYLQGIQTYICANLENPTTIIEFSPGNNPIPVRTDSRLLIYTMHAPCRVFRECTKHRHCFMSDNTHALLFHGLSRSDIPNELNNRIKSNERIQKYYPDLYSFPQIRSFENEREKKRWYMEYDCPLLGYRELLFPIFFEEQVVATFFTGQLCLEGKIDFINDRQKAYFKANPFRQEYANDDYRAKHPEIDFDIYKSLENYVSATHAEWFDDKSHIISPGKYLETIKKAGSEIAGLERTLEEQMLLQRERYVRTTIDMHIQEFNQDTPRELPDENILDVLWDNLKRRLDNFVHDFNLRYVVVFCINNLSYLKADVLNVVACAGDVSADLEEGIDSLKYDLSQIPSDVSPGPVTSVDEEKLFDGIEGLAVHPNKASHLVRIYPVPFLAAISMVIIVGYHDSNPGTSIENQKGGQLDAALQTFYAMVRSTLSSILAAALQKKRTETLRVFGHELGQLTSGLNWLQLTYLSDVNKIKGLPAKKIEDIGRDVEGYVRQIHFVFEQANMAVSSRSPNKTDFMAYRELLFKWRDTYRLEAERKDIQFNMPRPSSTNDPQRPPVYGDQALLEQLVYNLVNNAVKYCYRGTKIHMDCRKRDEGRYCPHILTVTNYGIELMGGNRIYELDFRGPNVKGQEGLGIGLNVARQIAKDHRGDINHTCKPISDFNVPLIEAYLKLFQNDLSLASRLREELYRLKSANQYFNIVALDENGKLRYAHPSKQEILSSIEKPTWEVTFTVTIPSKEA